MIKTIVRKLWQTSPADLFTIGRRKVERCLGNGDQGWNYSLEAVIKNPKHMNIKLEIERWERHWRICRLHGLGNLEKKFDFFGKSVLELGCGPVFGCGPVALFKGADKFWYQEPHLRRAVVESTTIKNKYFRPLYQELVANYGGQVRFDEWYSRVIELSQPRESGMEKAVDLTISHSVLEHIPRRTLSSVLAGLYEASRPGAWFSHTVDLGPHGHGDSTLAGLYRMNRDTEPPHLNLLRKCDVESAIMEAGLDLRAAVIYKADEIDDICVHQSWRRYSKEDLATRVVVFLGRRRHSPEWLGTPVNSVQCLSSNLRRALVQRNNYSPASNDV